MKSSFLKVVLRWRQRVSRGIYEGLWLNIESLHLGCCWRKNYCPLVDFVAETRMLFEFWYIKRWQTHKLAKKWKETSQNCTKEAYKFNIFQHICNKRHKIIIHEKSRQGLTNPLSAVYRQATMIWRSSQGVGGTFQYNATELKVAAAAFLSTILHWQLLQFIGCSYSFVVKKQKIITKFRSLIISFI